MLKIVVVMLGLFAGLPALEVDAAQAGGNIALMHTPTGGTPTSFTLNTRDWVILSVESTNPPVLVFSKPDEAGSRELMQRVNAWLAKATITAGSTIQGQGWYHLRLDTHQGSLMVGVADVEGSAAAREMKELLALFAAHHARSK